MCKITSKYPDEEFIRVITYEELRNPEDPDSFEHFGYILSVNADLARSLGASENHWEWGFTNWQGCVREKTARGNRLD